MKQGLLSSALARGAFGDGKKFINKVFLLIWRQLPPVTDTQSLPAQLLPQGSPKISTKGRGRYSPEALSKCKFSLFSSNPTLGSTRSLSHQVLEGVVSQTGDKARLHRRDRDICDPSTGSPCLDMEVGSNLSPGTVFLLLKPPISARSASTAQENRMNSISQGVCAITCSAHQSCCC